MTDLDERLQHASRAVHQRVGALSLPTLDEHATRVARTRPPVLAALTAVADGRVAQLAGGQVGIEARKADAEARDDGQLASLERLELERGRGGRHGPSVHRPEHLAGRRRRPGLLPGLAELALEGSAKVTVPLN